ncbi:MAG: nucleotidyltransferase family protein [Gemmatimonadales bacterium]|jgi:dTDP-glucose pyrophosphorylase
MRRRLAALLASGRATVLEAMRAINDGGYGIAFVTAAGGRIVGTLTDGDLRRGLLAGATLESRCLRTLMSREFVSVGLGSGRAEVLDMMRARGITAVPVVDGRGQLVALHTLSDLIGGADRPNWALLMAGGRGERLRPLTEKVPKPMLTVAGRPILERLVLHLVGHGIRRLYISVNHLASVIERHFRNGRRFGCEIAYLREDAPLGTGGAMTLLPERPRHPLLVLNGDLVTQFDVGRMLDFHRRGRYAVTFGVRPHTVAIPYGVAELRSGRLHALREKPTLHMLINAGIYVVSPQALRLVVRGREFPITDLLERCRSRQLRVGAHVIEDEWMDVGRHDELRKARGQLL